MKNISQTVEVDEANVLIQLSADVCTEHIELSGSSAVLVSESEPDFSHSLGSFCTTKAEALCRCRWEQFVTNLNGKSGWRHMQKSLLDLPEDVVATFDGLEKETGYCFQQNDRKKYYKAFFRKALGFAVISTLQMEELIHEQVDIGGADLQELMNTVPVNNGLFGFKYFISLLCDILVANEKSIQENQKSFFNYWYHRQIPLHPDAAWKQLWDAMIVCLLLYSSFQVPYNLAFEDDGDGSVDLSVLDSMLDVIFMVDVGLCFLTAYFDAKGMLVRDLRAIARQYAATWFLPDLGGSFPFDSAIGAFLDSPTQNIGAMRVLKIVRLMKLMRVVRVFRAMGDLGHKEGFAWIKGALGIVRSMLAIVFVAHALGCFNYLLFVPGSDRNWMYALRPEMRGAGRWPRYVLALYWAIVTITTMGYGDVVPVTHEERLFCVFVALVGAVVFSYCMGTITSLVMSLSGVGYQVSRKLQHAAEYAVFREQSASMERRLKGFYSISWRKSGALYGEPQILGELPSGLRTAALAEIGAKCKSQVPLFEGLPDECVGFLFTLMRRVDYAEGDEVYRPGDRATDMFFVLSGAVTVRYEKRLRRAKAQSFTKGRSGQAAVLGDRAVDAGGVFGEAALFPDQIPPFRAEAAAASSWVIAYTLSVQDVPRIEAVYPTVVCKLRELCQLRVAQSRASGNSWRVSAQLEERARGGVQHCCLNTTIAQLQRDLLLSKEQHALLPASGAEDGKVLKLLVSSSGTTEREAAEVTSISCVVSDRGELLCVEHTTEGIVGDGLRSLGFFVPGRSGHRLMEKDEVLQLAGKAASSRDATLFGCCITVLPENLGAAAGCAAPKEVHLFSWLEEEIESLVEGLDRLQENPKCLHPLHPAESSESKPESSAFIAKDQPGHGPGEPTSSQDHLATKVHPKCLCSVQQRQDQLSKESGADYPDIKSQRRPVQDLSAPQSKEQQLYPESHKDIKGHFCKAFSSENNGVSLSDFESGSLFNPEQDLFLLSPDTILRHAEWLILQTKAIKNHPDSLQRILMTVFRVHTLLTRSLVETIAQCIKDTISQPDGMQIYGGRNMCVDDGTGCSTVDAEPSVENGAGLSLGLDTGHLHANHDANDSSRERQVAAEQKPAPETARINPIETVPIPISIDEMWKGGSDNFLLAEATMRKKSAIVEEPESLDLSHPTQQSDSRQDETASKRWEVLVEHIIAENQSDLKWHSFKNSFLHLPPSVEEVFDNLDKSGSCSFQASDRKKYYSAFFRKASGFAVINSLQMEELLQAQIDVSGVDLQDMMNRMPVNNGLFSFESFAMILNEIFVANSIREQQEKIGCWERWYHRLIPIHPNALPKQIWDLIILILLMYSSFQVPYNIVFEDSQATSNNSAAFAKQVFHLILDVMFMVDVALCFITAYFDTKGLLERNLSLITHKYVTTWFLPDIGGSFPFDKVIKLFIADAGNLDAMRALKLVRFLKLLRVVRVFKVLNELGDKEIFAVLRKIIGIVQSLFVLVFVAHILGCFFTMLAADSPAMNWMVVYQADLQDADDWTRYITALYWAIISVTTMGYGDIKPVLESERLFCIFVALVGAVTFSFCMGTISAQITDTTGVQHRKSTKNLEVSEYLQFREISQDLQLKIKSFYALSWPKIGTLYKETEILEDLPASFRKAALIEIGSKCKLQVPIFQGLTDECIGYLFTLLRRIDLVEGSIIYQQGDRASEMYLIMSGSVTLLTDDKVQRSPSHQPSKTLSRLGSVNGKTLNVIDSGGVFGELGLFPDITPPFRSESAVANSWVILYTLSVQDLPKIEAVYPLVVCKLRELCQLRVAQSRASGHSRRRTEEMEIFAGDAVQKCTLGLKTVIAQMQRDLLAVKEQRVLLPASGAEDGKVLKLLIISCGSAERANVELTSISCVVSDRGELLCIEHTTEGIVGDGLRSLGFFVPGRSGHRLMGKDEVWRLAGIKELQLFGVGIVVYDQPGAAALDGTGGGSEGIGSKTCSGREIHLFSWLDEELEGLEESLDTLRRRDGPHLQHVPNSDAPAEQPVPATPPCPCADSP